MIGVRVTATRGCVGYDCMGLAECAAQTFGAVCACSRKFIPKPPTPKPDTKAYKQNNPPAPTLGDLFRSARLGV